MGSGTSKNCTAPRHYCVVLNLYNLTSGTSLVSMFGDLTGMRALHSGVAIYPAGQDAAGNCVPLEGSRGIEYAFGAGGGVWEQVPMRIPNFEGSSTTFRESRILGGFVATPKELSEVIKQMKKSWRGDSYDLLSKNCNHFADALCTRLLGQGIPKDVNRLANFGSAALGAVGNILDTVQNAVNAQSPDSMTNNGGVRISQILASAVKPPAQSMRGTD